MPSTRIPYPLVAVHLCLALTAAVSQLPDPPQHRRHLLQPHVKNAWHGALSHSGNRALQLLDAAGISRRQRAERIFIPMLTSRRDGLCQFITSFAQNVAPKNPSDVFVFSPQNVAMDGFKDKCSAANSSQMAVHFMPLGEHWAPPLGSAANSSLWSADQGAEYRQMGHWRLVFQYTLAKMLGYRYLWQLDDDDQFVLPVNTSLIGWMTDNNMLLSYRDAGCDIVQVTWALPELTRAFLVAERYTPVGTLFNHTKPAGLDGLYTTKQPQNGSFKITDGGGWDRMVLSGNCLMVDLEFWFQQIVQRYVELVTSSWYHYRFRWNEQSTIGMIWQLFVPSGQSNFLPIPAGGFTHKGGKREATYEVCASG